MNSTQLILLLLPLLLFAIGTATTCVHAAWVVNPLNGYPESMFTGTQTGSRDFRFSSSVKFKTTMERSRDLFPGSCVSNSPLQPYGWTAFKEELLPVFSGVSVRVSGSGTQITLRLFPRMGYTTNVDEIITCGPLDDFALDGTPPEDDRYITLAITTSSRVNTELLKFANLSLAPSHALLPFPGGPISEQLDETTFRQEGFKLAVALINDVWIQSKVRELASAITCTPGDCLRGFIRPEHIRYDTTLPNVVHVYVPREEMRLFNIDRESKITVQLPEPVRSFSGKDKEIVQASNSFRLLTVPVRDPLVSATSPELFLATATFDNRGFGSGFANPVVLPFNMMNITEDCLRGKDRDEAACPRLLFFMMWKPAVFANQYHRFSQPLTNDFMYEDMRAYGLNSSNGFDFSAIDWVAKNGWDIGGMNAPREQAQAILRLNRLWAYETVTEDIITVTVPFTFFTTLEPPAPYYRDQPLRIRVTPSPGAFVGGLHDIEQREIWFGNVVQYLVLDGESWKPSVLSTIIAESTGTAELGWDKQKADLFNPANNASVGFNTSEFFRGKLNQTTIRIVLARNPDFELVVLGGLKYETVTFKVDDTMVQSSARPFAMPGSVSFRIHSSPGTYTLDAPATVEEADVRAGGITIELNLAGQKFLPDITACAAAICGYWNSSVLGTTDVDAWENRHPIICNANGITRVNNRTLRMTWAADPQYNTVRGETIWTQIPTVCTGGEVAPERPMIRILPQNGNVTLYYSLDGGATLLGGPGADHSVTETVVRLATVKLYLVIVNDTWDANYAFIMARDLAAGLISQSAEAFGWNNKKSQLIRSVVILDPQRVEIELRKTTTYDTAGNETIELALPAAWFSSKRAPKVPLVRFRILASAGSVELVNWFGADNKRVTEEDVLWGRVWFEFSLLGDQWRRDTSPFVRSFTSSHAFIPLEANTSFARLIPQLMPSILFFRFTLGADGGEVMRFRLQSNFHYDIATVETVTLRLQRDTVVSSIAPFFYINNVEFPSFSFQVHPMPGRLVLSGAFPSLNEKKMRQSTALILYLTLFGESWSIDRADNTTSAILESTVVIAAPRSSVSSGGAAQQQQLNPNGFVAFKASILPRSRIEIRSPQEIVMHLVPNRNYEISSDEWIEIDVPGFAVLSGLKPLSNSMDASPDGNKLRIVVQPTGGELRILPVDFVLEERQLRTQNLTVQVAVDGDQWSQTDIVDQSVTLVADGFASLASEISEPHGFNARKQGFLNIGGGKRPFVSAGASASQESTLRVLLNPESTYDIDADELIQFSVIDASLFSTKLLPDPRSVQILVRAAPRRVVLIIDQTVPFAVVFRNNLEALKQKMSALLGVPLARQKLELNGTAVRPSDGMLVVLLTFLPSDTSSLMAADPRPISLLSSLLLSISDEHLYKMTAARFAFPEESPPAAADLVVRPTTTTSIAVPVQESDVASVVGYVVGSLFIGLMAVGFVVGLRLQRARVATSALKSSRRKRRNEGATEFEDENVARREAAIELSVNPRLRHGGLSTHPMLQHKQHNGVEYEEGRITEHMMPPTTLRDHVQQSLGLKDPYRNAENIKVGLRQLFPDEDKYLPSATPAALASSSVEPSTTAEQQQQHHHVGDTGGTKKFQFRNREALKHLATLMDA